MTEADIDPRLGKAARLSFSLNLSKLAATHFSKWRRCQTNARRDVLDLRAKRDLSQKITRQLAKTGIPGTIGPSSTYSPLECKRFRIAGSLGFEARPAA
jgi:hypothetical protein